MIYGKKKLKISPLTCPLILSREIDTKEHLQVFKMEISDIIEAFGSCTIIQHYLFQELCWVFLVVCKSPYTLFFLWYHQTLHFLSISKQKSFITILN